MLKLFCLGIPKTGTMTISVALESAGLSVAHSSTKDRPPTGFLLCKAHAERKDPMTYLPFEAVTHPSVCVPRKSWNHWPQMDLDLLDSLRKRHKRAIFCLNTRPVGHLVRSIESWRDQQARYTGADIPGLPPGKGGEAKELEKWINWHWNRMREFFDGDWRFFEVDIEDESAKELLSVALGVKIETWPWVNKTPTK